MSLMQPEKKPKRSSLWKIWETFINLLQAIESGLDTIDENEPKGEILADLQESIRQARAGQTYPISELWDDIDS